MWLHFVAKPVVGAGIGWFTNWLAIRMLFRPRRRRRVLGLSVQGVIPRRRGELAARVADAFERELFSHDDIKAALQNPDYHEALRARIEEHVRSYLSEMVARSPRLLRVLVGEGLVGRVASAAANGAMRHVPTLIEGAAKDLEASFDIREVIRAKVEGLDLDHLEAIVRELARRELRFIEFLGGVVGFVVGATLAVVECLLAA